MAKSSPPDPRGPAPDPDGRTGQEARSSRNTPTSDPHEAHDRDPSTLTTPAGTGAPFGSAHVEAQKRDAVPKAPAKAKAADLPVLDAYPDTGHGLQDISLDGGGVGGGATYRVGKPIPQDLTVGSDIYNLSDRAKGIYTFRVK
jgi:hypothetical protein